MLTQLHGKPFYVKLDGKQRNIGTISVANIDAQRTQLEVTIDLTDEEVAGILGAAADKAEAAESPIGMSAAEIAAIVEDEKPDPGPFKFIGVREMLAQGAPENDAATAQMIESAGER